MSKIQDIQTIFSLMERFGISMEDLILHDQPIEATKKFPLPVYFSDGTRSSDVNHYYGQNRQPLGVVIGDTLYALHVSDSIFIDDIQECLYDDDFFKRQYVLPTKKQLDTLMEHIRDYNKIRLFFGWEALNPQREAIEIAISDERNCETFQYRYDIQSRDVYGSNGLVHILPVINL